MKINGVVIRDTKKDKFFAFVEQFPGICAQGNTAKEATDKMNAYFQMFIERVKGKEVKTGDIQVV